MLVDVLKENRVETKGCRFDPNARTALAFVTLRADGEREFMFYRNPSADMLFEVKELDTDILKQVMNYLLFQWNVHNCFSQLNVHWLFYSMECSYLRKLASCSRVNLQVVRSYLCCKFTCEFLMFFCCLRMFAIYGNEN